MLQSNLSSIKKFFHEILSKNISSSALEWIDKSINQLQNSQNEKAVLSSFSIAPRFVGKAKLNLTHEDLQHSNQLKEGFKLQNFSVDQLTRTLLLLNSYKGDIQVFSSNIKKIISVADINEQVAIYSAMSLFPHPEHFTDIAADGIRTNITAVFDAIVLENPFPSEHLSDDAWNQMVLKAIFINRPLFKIWGFDARRNILLAQMISDFAHERWAAGRTLSPEIWRILSPFIDKTGWEDIDRILKSENPLEVEAGGLVCFENSSEDAKSRLSKIPKVELNIKSGKLSWKILGEKLLK